MSRTVSFSSEVDFDSVMRFESRGIELDKQLRAPETRLAVSVFYVSSDVYGLGL